MIRRWSSLLCSRSTRLRFLDKSPHAAAAFATKAPPEDAKAKKKKETGKKKKKKDPDAGLSEHDRHRFDELVQKALCAPSPVRHITEKERLREAELERYGLMTKAKQIELEQQKARERAKKKAAASGEGGEAGDETMTPLDKEEGARLAKAYSRLLMRTHRQQQAGESLRLRLKKAAIEALPPGLKEAALVNDMTPFPGISPATLTPPIPGFKYEYELPKDKPKEASADAA